MPHVRFPPLAKYKGQEVSSHCSCKKTLYEPQSSLWWTSNCFYKMPTICSFPWILCMPRLSISLWSIHRPPSTTCSWWLWVPESGHNTQSFCRSTNRRFWFYKDRNFTHSKASSSRCLQVRFLSKIYLVVLTTTGHTWHSILSGPKPGELKM